MASLDKAVVAKLKKENKVYEILVDSEKALEFRSGKSMSINDALVTDEIFYDAKKGIKASENELKRLFGTDDKTEICKVIIKEGNVPMTAELLRREIENKKKQIVNMIHRNIIDPNTGKPHPPQRIEAAIHEAKVKIDEHKTAEQQVQAVIDQIRRIIPIKYEIREISVKIPAQHTGRAFPIIKQFGKLLQENWTNDGSLLATIEIPAGIQEEFEIALNKIARGSIEIKILKTN